VERLTACPVCNSKRSAFAFVGRTTSNPKDGASWHVERCVDCSLGYLNPQPSWADLQRYYTEEYSPYRATDDVENAANDALAAGELRFVPIPDGKHLLDVGCGGGFFLRVCRRLGASVKGIEPSPIGARFARSYDLEVFNGTVDKFETDDRFDIITVNQVLEHVPDPVATLARLKQLLALSGTIIIAVPNAACRWAKKLRWKWDGADLPYHLMQFTPQSLSRAAQEAGLKVCRIRTYSDPRIVSYSVRKHLRENWFIPQRITAAVYPRWRARQLGASLDRKCAGDNLIAELSA
jgi:SAM-dependent methyltransferase